MVPWYWLIVAFAIGIAVEWKIGLWLLRWALNEDLEPFARTLSKLPFNRLLRVQTAVEREIDVRRP